MSAVRCATFVFTAVFVGSVVSGSGAEPPSAGPGAATLETSASRRPSRDSASSAAAATTGASRQPFLHPRLTKRVAARLTDALPVAQERLREYPSCQALFARFEADGVATLNGTSYYPAGRKQERKYCRTGTHAVTEVGGSAVVVCRSFGRLSDQQAATILLHEALHGAGQTEFPSDPNAPDAFGITKMVMKGCRLF
jgi:hypothetical protein